MQRARVFVVEGLDLVRRGIADVVCGCDDLLLVGLWATIDGPATELRAAAPDVVVLDLDADGSVELARRLVDGARIVFLTLFPHDARVLEATSIPASIGVKTAGESSIVSLVRAAAAGECRLDPVVTARVVERLKDVSRTPALPELNERQRVLLELISRGMTNREIGRELSLAEQTVKNYVSDLLSRLGLRGRAQAAALSATIAARTREPEAAQQAGPR